MLKSIINLFLHIKDVEFVKVIIHEGINQDLLKKRKPFYAKFYRLLNDFLRKSNWSFTHWGHRFRGDF